MKKGVALDRFLQNIVINKKVDIRKMLVGDKNALVVAARISGYGADYHTRVTCPACLAKVEHSFDLSDSAVKSADDIDFEDLDVEQTERGTFLLILPKMNVNVELRLLNGIDEAEIVRLSEQNKKNKKVPATDARHLRKKYQAITPTIDMTQHFECVDCGHEQEMEVPFTTDFFWPDR